MTNKPNFPGSNSVATDVRNAGFANRRNKATGVGKEEEGGRRNEDRGLCEIDETKPPGRCSRLKGVGLRLAGVEAV